jgi:hypothetical protein
VLVFQQRHFNAFTMRLTVEKLVFILESYLKTMSYAVDKVFLKNLEGNLKQLQMNITRSIEEVNKRTQRKVTRNMVKCVDKCNEINGHHFQR